MCFSSGLRIPPRLRNSLGAVKLVDVARAANCSSATVSRVLNDNPPVDQQIRAQVIQASRELGYLPTAMPLVASLAKAYSEKRLDEKLLSLAKAKLLIVDELGYLPLEPDAAHLFFQLVSRRYEMGAILITSNRSVAEWGAVFGDPVAATAILDRLLHSHVLTIRGDSYRLRAKRKSGLFRPPAGDGAPVGSASLRAATGDQPPKP
jgi:IstB-like ATP binding protein/Bacterial regulatory proteins, lacI family